MQCPVCGANYHDISSLELHVNSHFDDALRDDIMLVDSSARAPPDAQQGGLAMQGAAQAPLPAIITGHAGGMQSDDDDVCFVAEVPAAAACGVHAAPGKHTAPSNTHATHPLHQSLNSARIRQQAVTREQLDNSQPQQQLNQHCVLCPLGCGQWIPLSDLNSHELQHALTAGHFHATAGAEAAAASCARAPPYVAIDAAGPSTATAGRISAAAVAMNAHAYTNTAVNAAMDDVSRKTNRQPCLHSSGTAGSWTSDVCDDGDEWGAHDLLWLGQVPEGHDNTHTAMHDEDADAALARMLQEEEEMGLHGPAGNHHAGAGHHTGKDSEALARKLQEASDFEALQAKYGFAPKRRKGRCFTCGEEGHFSTECPTNARAQAWRAAGALPTNPAALVGVQQPDPTCCMPQSAEARATGSNAVAATSSGSIASEFVFDGGIAAAEGNGDAGGCGGRGGGRGGGGGGGGCGGNGGTDLPPAGRLIDLLARRIAASAASLGPNSCYQAYLCSPLQHFSAGYADRGWGCGWRNIQMLSSALLRRSPMLKDALFGGFGRVPDIASLQAWLESAWAAGFDPPGAESLGGRIQGERKWIGTTEAVALLRSFGVQACIVDFMGAGTGATSSYTFDGPCNAPTHHGVECDGCGVSPVVGIRHQSQSRSNYDLCCTCVAQPALAGAAAPFLQIPHPLEWAQLREQAQRAQHAQGMYGASTTAGISSTAGGRSASTAAPSSSAAPGRASSSSGPEQKRHVHGPLVDWVWAYFSGQHAATRHMHAHAQARQSCQGQAQNTQQQDAFSVLMASAGHSSAGGTSNTDSSRTDRGNCSAVAAICSGRPVGPMSEKPAGQHAAGPVVLSGMPPLYFQHEGHSRTVIGVERRRVKSKDGGVEDVYTLLVLDPGQAAHTLLKDLESDGPAWARAVRRGSHTLRKLQYQVLYVLDEVVPPQGRELLKAIRASEVIRALANAPAVLPS